MGKLKKWLLIIEVFLVFCPMAIGLVAGYLWAPFAILEMVYTLSLPIRYLMGICAILLATFGVIGVVKLTLLKVNPGAAIKVNDKIFLYILAGWVACLIMLILMEPKSMVEGFPFLLPILVSVQLLWINRSNLRNKS